MARPSAPFRRRCGGGPMCARSDSSAQRTCHKTVCVDAMFRKWSGEKREVRQLLQIKWHSCWKHFKRTARPSRSAAEEDLVLTHSSSVSSKKKYCFSSLGPIGAGEYRVCGTFYRCHAASRAIHAQGKYVMQYQLVERANVENSVLSRLYLTSVAEVGFCRISHT